MDRNGPEDRISLLPDEILIHILSFLDVKYTIRTSTLSRRWGHLWTMNPDLNFNLGRELGDRCIQIIYRSLLFYKCTDMNSFCIDVELNEDLSNDIGAWIRFATSRKVRELYVKMDAEDEIPLPQSLYGHTPLTVLELSSCFLFNLPVGFKGYPYLNILDLYCVRIGDEAVTTLLSTSPLLEKLSFSCCPDLVNLSISAPNNCIQSLEFDRCPDLEKLDVDAPQLYFFRFLASSDGCTKIYLKNSSSLRDAHVDFSLQQKESNPEEVHEHAALLRCMAHVDYLEVHDWFCQFIFAEYFVLKSPHMMFMNLKEFNWSGHVDSRYLILALATYLGNCPSLEHVTIKCFPKKNSPFYSNWHKRYYGLLEDSPPPLQGSVLPHLKTIQLINPSGTKKEMYLLRFLLSKATVLDSLFVTFWWSIRNLKNLKVLKKISVLSKAWPNVKVLYKLPPSSSSSSI